MGGFCLLEGRRCERREDGLPSLALVRATPHNISHQTWYARHAALTLLPQHCYQFHRRCAVLIHQMGFRSSGMVQSVFQHSVRPTFHASQTRQ